MAGSLAMLHLTNCSVSFTDSLARWGHELLCRQGERRLYNNPFKICVTVFSCSDAFVSI